MISQEVFCALTEGAEIVDGHGRTWHVGKRLPEPRQGVATFWLKLGSCRSERYSYIPKLGIVNEDGSPDPDLNAQNACVRIITMRGT